MLKLFCITAFAAHSAAQLPTVKVSHDDTTITESCVIEIADGTVIEDVNGNGVIHIGADNVVVQFSPTSVLLGAAGGTPGDALKGTGIRVEGRKGVTLSGVRVQGYKVGIRCTDTEGLLIDKARLRENFRQRLKSTPEAEDAADWLYPHNNDKQEWITNYGAAICVERSRLAIVMDCTVQAGQNGIILDRVTESQAFGNDCRYLSGWGIAMWRSSDNVIARNRLDFCVRGYSHGVYNRGQDSAGILMFEQCSRNVIAENSATHSGDGLFGFAGREAIGETELAGFDVKRAGCNDNIIIDNDFSDCVAHGLEMTFSFGNRIIRNKFSGDAICGIWAGYSQDTFIAQNSFENCGDMAYGLERGGVNIEHGAGNVIVDNSFKSNACGVHLWWDDDKALLERPWAKANHRGVTGNIVCNNSFDSDKIALQIRDLGSGNVRENAFFANSTNAIESPLQATRGAEPVTEGTKPTYEIPSRSLPGSRRAVNIPNMRGLRGRQSIVMGEWGPWDGETPLLNRAIARPASHLYEFRKFPGDANVTLEGSGVEGRLVPAGKASRYPTYVVSTRSEGVFPYLLKVQAGDFHDEVRGTVANVVWDLKVFQWAPEVDPREKLAEWRALANSAPSAKVAGLDFAFAMKGPSDQKLSESVTQAGLLPDRFGLIGTSTVTLAPGNWRLNCRSDDGVRILVDGKPVLENWTWHGPTKDTAEFTVAGAGPTRLTVEYFEIDGYAVLELELVPVE